MTLVIGYRTDEGAVLMADRLLQMGDKQSISAEPKIEKRGPFVICGSGSTVSCRALSDAAYDYFVLNNDLSMSELVLHVKQILKSQGLTRYDTDSECDVMNSSAVVLYKGEVYFLDAAFALIRYAEPYAISGAPTYMAVGACAMLPYAKTNAAAIRNLKRVFRVVSKHHSGLRPPFDVVTQMRS